MLSSCGREYGILSYQEGDLCAICRVNDEYVVSIKKEGDFRALEIIEPSALCGVSFVLKNGNWRAVSGDMEIPLESTQIQGIAALCSMFDMSEAWISSALDDDGYGIVDFAADNVLYRITYGALALPTHITIEADTFTHNVEIISIESESIASRK